MNRRVERWEIAGTAFCAMVFIALRWPLFTMPGIQLGWHSDAALLGLMARAIVSGDYPILFWATDYLAPLTSVFAVLASIFNGAVDPLALRIGTAIEVFAAMVFCQAALRRALGRRAALLATFWITAGPAFLFKLTYAPLSAEQYFFLGSIAFYYVARARFTRLHQWLLLGLLAGVGWWVHRGVTFVIAPSLLTIARYDAEALQRWRDRLAAAFALIAGIAIGVTPIAFGKVMIDQRLYLPVKADWSIANVLQRVTETIFSDFWELLGAEHWLLGIAFVVLFARAAPHIRLTRETFLTLSILATAFAFWIFSTDAYKGAVRYIVIALPILYAIAASQLVQLWDTRKRAFALIGLAIITIGLYVPRIQQTRNVAAARLERHEHWPGGFDPRPSLAELQRGHYTVCYANVWIAHKLEWLSDPTVRFIPYRSVNRRMVESLRLASTPGPKCFVDLQGHVRPLTGREERELRLEVLWHAQGWKRSTEGLR
jgi:hypothetical protein